MFCAKYGDVIYSREWTKSGFYVPSIPRFDILIKDGEFYLLQFPKFHAGTWGLLIGLLVFSLFGAIIGAFIGQSMDKKKREKIRSAWMSSSDQLLSEKYKDHIAIATSLSNLKTIAKIEGQTLEIKHGETTVKIKSSKNEIERVFNTIL